MAANDGSGSQQRPRSITQPQSSTSPYQGGLQTDYTANIAQGDWNPYRLEGRRTWHRTSGPAQYDYNTSTSNDADVRRIQYLTNANADAARGNNYGVDQGAGQAEIDMLKGRIGIKNSLAERIAQSGGEMNAATDSVTSAGNAALDSGVRNTRQNFNNRGLLYSGMREGGEQSVRGAVANQMARGYAGARRDNANVVASAKNAYSAVDLENQQQQLALANSAFDTASANNIARLQAMQQLGKGVGQAGGMIAGSYYGNSSGSGSKGTFGSDYYGDGYNYTGNAPQYGQGTAI